VCPLQGLQKETFLELLDGAVGFNMPKLLACCEHRIALDRSDKSGLWLPSLLVEHLNVSSAVRIAAALREVVRDSNRSQSLMLDPIDFLRMRTR
jgi:hypothetical protein